jgi:hypothetical protein
VLPNYQHLLGSVRTINIVTVRVPVIGSHELLEYRVTGEPLSMASISTPNGGSISMELQVPALDKEQVLTQAMRELQATKALIALNNPQAEARSRRTGAQIDKLAAQKRKELMAFYN